MLTLGARLLSLLFLAVFLFWIILQYQSLSFGQPRLLSLLFLLPPMGFLFWMILRHIEKVRRQFNMAQVSRTGRVSTRFRYTRLAFWFMVGCGSLIVALAAPQLEISTNQEIYRKINVVFLLDTSLSMRAKDIAPSRIDRARQEMQNFILHRQENIGQIGLVNFAGSSVILSYFTSDASNILFYLEYLRADLRPSFGTDIGSGFKNGLLLLEKEQELDDTLRTEDTIFILISDGEDHGEVLREAVQKGAELGLRTYCVGLGTQLGGYIPMGQRDGHTVFLTDEEGERVLATFDEGTMRWVAGTTGGRYYRSRSGTELYQNLNEILWNERKVIGTKNTTDVTPLYYWFLVSGFAALAVFLMD